MKIREKTLARNRVVETKWTRCREMREETKNSAGVTVVRRNTNRRTVCAGCDTAKVLRTYVSTKNIRV